MGVVVRCGTAATALVGADGAVTSVTLQDGTTLTTDMVVISCGIRPNVEVARDAGLAVDRAVVVDDQLRTSDSAAFAVGECAEHRGKVYGLVDPVYEQARVLADVLTGANGSAAYTGSRLATSMAAIAPAPRATTNTMIRAGFMTLNLPIATVGHELSARNSTGKGQGAVK